MNEMQAVDHNEEFDIFIVFIDLCHSCLVGRETLFLLPVSLG